MHVPHSAAGALACGRNLRAVSPAANGYSLGLSIDCPNSLARDLKRGGPLCDMGLATDYSR